MFVCKSLFKYYYYRAIYIDFSICILHRYNIIHVGSSIVYVVSLSATFKYLIQIQSRSIIVAITVQ